MKNITSFKTFTVLLFTILTSLSFGQGFQINSINPSQTPNLQCDSVVSISISALNDSISSGADISMILQGANFQATQFQVQISWGDGTNTIHYGGTSSSGTPIPFSPAIEHVYTGVGSQTIIVQIVNPQNNTNAICTVPITIQNCQIYLYSMVSVDCNNDGTNESTIQNGIPILLTNGTDQYSATLVNNSVIYTGVPLGNYTISIDPFWLNSNGYVVNSLSPSNLVVGGPTTTYTTQVVLNCSTPTQTNQCVSGFLYCDANMNGVFDSGETPIPNAPVNIQTNTGTMLTVYTDANGFYSASFTAASQTPTIVSINPNWMIQNGYTIQSYIYTTITTNCGTTNPLINFPVACPTQNPTQGCVSGFVWCDANGDGDFDTNEIPLIGAPVMLQGAGIYITVYSDSNGFYTYCGTILNQSFVVGSLNPNWLATHGYTIPNNYYTMQFMGGINTQPVGFGVNCGGTPNTCADLWTTVTPWIGYYQNQTNYIRLNFGNYGPGAPGNYTVTFTFPAGVTPITSSINIPGWTISGNTITWNLNSNLTSFSQNDVIYFNTPSGITSGTQHYFTSTIVPTGTITDCCTTNNTGSLLQIVGNSYDPNDKTVDLPAGIDHTIQDELTYIIRFQNTGTAPAQDVYIIDTLSANLDWSTMEVLETTHQMQLVDLGNGVIRFDFPQIWLPDSTSNEPMSHGYVVFKIKENVGNISGSEIFNTGHIYFDWNPAIITNTTYNINGSLGIEDLETEVSIYPNPTTDNLTISAATEMQLIQVVDMTGKIVLTQKVSSDKAVLQLATFDSGMYLIQLETANGMISKRIIKK